jgi:hypothetical protein
MPSALLRRMFIVPVIFLTSASSALCQQRMGIAAGALDIAANEIGQVATYCLDFSRASPTSGDSYSHVLTGNESATVHFDNGTTIPLQQALQQHLVEMKGRHISFADLLNSVNDPAFQARAHINGADKQQYTEMAKLWNAATPAERTAIEQAFEHDTPDLWDHTHLQLVNKTKQHLKVSFDETTVLSPREESLQGAAYTHIGDSDGAKTSVPKQQQLWTLGDRQQQSALAYLGYYKGDIDGLTGPATKTAIKNFQAAESLPLSGQFDASTTEALHRRYNTKRLSDIGAQSPDLTMVTITSTPGSSRGRYTVEYGQSGSRFATDSPMDLGQKLNNIMSSSGTKSLYIDFDSFTDDRASALTSNLRRQQKAVDPTIELHGMTRSEADPELQGLLLDRPSRIEATAVRVEEITDGPQKGLFRSAIDLIIHIGNSVRRVSVSIVSATRAYAVELAQLIGIKVQSQALVATSGAGKLSAAQIVAAAERGLSQDAYSKQVQSQFGTVDISKLKINAVPVG